MSLQTFVTFPSGFCCLLFLAVIGSNIVHTQKGLDLFLEKTGSEDWGESILGLAYSKEKRNLKINCKNLAFIKHLWAPGIVLALIHLVSQIPPNKHMRSRVSPPTPSAP